MKYIVKDWFINWINNLLEALKKWDTNLKRKQLKKGEVNREDRLIQKQIENVHQKALEKKLDWAEEHIDLYVLDVIADNENLASPSQQSKIENRGCYLFLSARPS
jgi:hypothetical protein